MINRFNRFYCDIAVFFNIGIIHRLHCNSKRNAVGICYRHAVLFKRFEQRGFISRKLLSLHISSFFCRSLHCIFLFITEFFPRYFADNIIVII